jgi:teichuronic acid biosynthesis glycosyltransferase TuaG
MISVVIPCYNAAAFIKETLDSVIGQTGQDLEIIIIDDGSTDSSAAIIQSYSDRRIVYRYQQNQGVSAARNYGLELATGEFIVFFDADDKMSVGFLEERKNELNDNPAIDYVCGPVKAFPVEQPTSFGVAENVARELLTYNPTFSSCPSNYLIRRSALEKHRLRFNEHLSSTADRFFLIQLASLSKGHLIKAAPLFYRINENSMSNKFSKSLVEDNERYLKELSEHKLIPEFLKDEFLFKIQYILGLGFIRTGVVLKGIKYAWNAFIKNPRNFINQIV